MTDWQQQAQEEAIKEVVPDTSVVSDNDGDDQEENSPQQLFTSEAPQHPYDLLHLSMMENDATFTGLITKVTDKVQNIKLSALRQSNTEIFFFEILNNER